MTRYLRSLAARLRGLFGGRRADRELGEEIETHLRLLTERYAARMSRPRRLAVAVSSRRHITPAIEMRVKGSIPSSRMRYGVRMLKKNPVSDCRRLTPAWASRRAGHLPRRNVVLLKPLPYYDPQRLVWVSKVEITHRFSKVYKVEESPRAADYLRWQAESKAFEQLVAFNSGRIYLTGRGNPERLDSVLATANLFPALGVSPQLGRRFRRTRIDPRRAAILGHALGSDASAAPNPRSFH